MGSVNKNFCDYCGKEIINKNHNITFKEDYGNPIFPATIELCPDCFYKLLNHFKEERNIISSSWTIKEPEVKEVIISKEG